MSVRSNKNNKKTIYVAMSGGVDSSVAAALLKKRGFSVVGVFMKPWSPEQLTTYDKQRTTEDSKSSIASRQSPVDCTWKEDREDVLRVAARLDIPLLTWDLSKEYEKRVVRYMIDGYKKGITPNPDVMCNKFIKFGVFLDKALGLGADFIATGHYVRIKPRRGPAPPNPHRAHYHSARRVAPSRVTPLGFSLHVAKDRNKDQSYFLYTLNQKQLKRCFFPIGDYKKSEIRKMAKKFGLPNWNKKDSQGVCFVGPLAMDKFLKGYIKPQKGQVIKKSDGRVLGEHDGVWYYTIGQRHGFALNGGQPYYVVGKDVEKNILYVEKELGVTSQELRVNDFNWVGGEKRLPMKCKVKMRYRQKDLDSVIVKNGGAVAHAKIAAKNIAVAPGQSAVFYKGNEVLGGGIIM